MAVGYGWPNYSAQTPNEEILCRLLALNRADESGYVATAPSHSTVTQADFTDELHAQVRDAVACHFDAQGKPKLIRLHFVRDEALAARSLAKRTACAGTSHHLRSLKPRPELRDNFAMSQPTIDLSTMRKALAMLTEALTFWAAQPSGAPLKPHLRSAVIQSFEFSYELSVRLLRRVLIERSESADRVADLSFNDLLRAGADAGLLADATQWREWREMRNATRHAYDEARAQAVAERAAAFAEDAAALLAAMERNLEH